MHQFLVGGSQFETPIGFDTFENAMEFIREEAMAETLPTHFQLLDRHSGITFNIHCEEN